MLNYSAWDILHKLIMCCMQVFGDKHILTEFCEVESSVNRAETVVGRFSVLQMLVHSME